MKVLPFRRFALLSILCSCLHSVTFSQYWQQQVDYIIDVTLNDKEHTLDGFEKMEYSNNSPDTLRFIWFHVWPNAYKNDQTAFSDQLLENGNSSFYFSGAEQKGFINRLDFKVNNVTAKTEDHPHYIDIIKLVLPDPLAPGQKINISTPFHVKLPYNYSRGGHDGQSYQATQWYPKPAVYDATGWHPMPYLDQGEFYSEFGTYVVSITVPQNYVVAATGELQDLDEINWLKSRTSFRWEPLKHRVKIKGGGYKTTVQLYPESSRQSKTLHYSQNNIHDFAWFADKRFIVNQDSCRLSSGKIINVFSYYTDVYKQVWSKSVRFAKDAIRHYSALVGEYPYNVVSVVQGPASFGGGMEYPTITVISPGESSADLDNTIAHEIGHNWFYGILATNESDYPWMDEGINTFYDNKYSLSKYGPDPQWERIQFETKAFNKTDQPINTTSEKFSLDNYDLVAYYKTGEWMRYLESQIGSSNLDKAMQDYYQQWKFKHPQPQDFKNIIATNSKQQVDSIFSYLARPGILPNQVRKGSKTIFVVPPKNLRSWLQAPTKDLYLFGPAIGFNSYDKLMVGGFVTNVKFPPSSLQFFVAPMYATGSKQLTGLGFLRHQFYPNQLFRKVELSIVGSSFTADQYNDETGKKNFLSFLKIVPGIKLTWKDKNPRSTFNRFLQFKTFLIREEGIHFYREAVVNPQGDTIMVDKYQITRSNRSLNQLQLVIENNRELYPYRGEIKLEQGKDFIRAAFTGNYFFNYPKEGGLSVRVFAGKFFYTKSKTFSRQFATDRYHLNMTGANGYEDYTYSDYFVGRNKFEGFASQQIMIRDGGFKVRTDLLAQKVGKTDDWLAAANITTTIPSNINPLSLLPIKIPLKIYLDIGTYAEAWKPNAETDRFFFNAGLQLPLLKETINFYLPIFYSSVYKSYIQSTLPKKGRLWHVVSFSIDISRLNLRKIDPKLEF